MYGIGAGGSRAGGFGTPASRALQILLVAALPSLTQAAGTGAGTVIENQAEVQFQVAGNSVSLSSNVVTIVVDERIDVAVVALSDQVSVAAGDSDRALLFSITNTGNGSEAFSLSQNSQVAGDDFDPTPAQPAIYIDSDASGSLTLGDVAYTPGSNDPVLAPDETVSVLVVNDIPAGLPEGAIGRTSLDVAAVTGSGAPGTVLASSTVGGETAVAGSSGGDASVTAEYIASSVQVDVVKSVTVSDPFGGDVPLPGATLTYSIDVSVVSGTTAANAIVTDPVPENTLYTPGSLFLNGIALTDAADGDAGELDPSGPAIVVRLGDLDAAAGTQSITFEVTIE